MYQGHGIGKQPFLLVRFIVVGFLAVCGLGVVVILYGDIVGFEVNLFRAGQRG
jgi:hypothetical protein